MSNEKPYTGDERRKVLDWHQTKPTAYTIIVLLSANILSSIWWAATITSDVENLKKRPDVLERVIRNEARLDEQSQIIIKITATLDHVADTMNKIALEQARRTEVIENAKKHLRLDNNGHNK